jgi:hypothetical protein
MVALWLAAAAALGVVTVALYARDLSKPQADFSLAAATLCGTVVALCIAGIAWDRRKNLRKIDQAGKAAAVLTDTGDSTASRSDDRG